MHDGTKLLLFWATNVISESYWVSLWKKAPKPQRGIFKYTQIPLWGLGGFYNDKFQRVKPHRAFAEGCS